MRPVMSFWSEPYIKDHYNHWINGNTWNLSWILSVESVSKIYGKPHLYTDSAGKNFLVDQLGLQFESVSLDLNDLKGKNSKFFSLGKTYAMSLQKEPFFHIDYDAYLFESIPVDLLDRGIFFEKESTFNTLLKLGLVQRPDLFNGIKGLPSWWVNNNIIKAYKSGIVGGSNLEFFYKFSNTVFDIIDSNSEEKWDEINKSINTGGIIKYNVFSPQYTIDECVSVGVANSMGISPRFMVNQNGVIASKFAHIHGEKATSSEFYGRILRRLSSDYPHVMDIVNKIEPNKNVSPKVSVIVIPTEDQSSYDTVLRSLIPRKIAPNELFVSNYNLKESDRNLLSRVEGVRIIPGAGTYMESLSIAFRKTSGNIVIVIDGHIRVPKLYIEKSIAAYLEYKDTVFCTASSDFSNNPHVFSYGALQNDSEVYPNIEENQSFLMDTPKVQSLYGGMYIFPSKALHAIFDSTSNISVFNEISSLLENKGFDIRCIKNIVSSNNFKIPLPEHSFKT